MSRGLYRLLTTVKWISPEVQGATPSVLWQPRPQGYLPRSQFWAGGEHLAEHPQAVVNHVHLGLRVMHPAHRIPLPQMEFAWMRNHRESLARQRAPALASRIPRIE